MTTPPEESERTNPAAPTVQYLADLIKDVPEDRRLTFITALKDAIREGQFDGTPLGEQFTLTYQARGKGGPEKRKRDQRDFAVATTPAFQTWFDQQLNTTVTRSPFPSRDQLTQGAVSLQDLAARYRNRSGGSSKRKGRR